MVGCLNKDCGVSVYRYELDFYKSKCLYKEILCGYCYNIIKVVWSDEYLESCLKVNIRCLNNCRISILRYLLDFI